MLNTIKLYYLRKLNTYGLYQVFYVTLILYSIIISTFLLFLAVSYTSENEFHGIIVNRANKIVNYIVTTFNMFLLNFNLHIIYVYVHILTYLLKYEYTTLVLNIRLFEYSIIVFENHIYLYLVYLILNIMLHIVTIYKYTLRLFNHTLSFYMKKKYNIYKLPICSINNIHIINTTLYGIIIYIVNYTFTLLLKYIITLLLLLVPSYLISNLLLYILNIDCSHLNTDLYLLVNLTMLLYIKISIKLCIYIQLILYSSVFIWSTPFIFLIFYNSFLNIDLVYRYIIHLIELLSKSQWVNVSSVYWVYRPKTTKLVLGCTFISAIHIMSVIIFSQYIFISIYALSIRYQMYVPTPEVSFFYQDSTIIVYVLYILIFIPQLIGLFYSNITILVLTVAMIYILVCILDTLTYYYTKKNSIGLLKSNILKILYYIQKLDVYSIKIIVNSYIVNMYTHITYKLNGSFCDIYHTKVNIYWWLIPTKFGKFIEDAHFIFWDWVIMFDNYMRSGIYTILIVMYYLFDWDTLPLYYIINNTLINVSWFLYKIDIIGIFMKPITTYSYVFPKFVILLLLALYRYKEVIMWFIIRDFEVLPNNEIYLWLFCIPIFVLLGNLLYTLVYDIICILTLYSNISILYKYVTAIRIFILCLITTLVYLLPVIYLIDIFIVLLYKFKYKSRSILKITKFTYILRLYINRINTIIIPIILIYITVYIIKLPILYVLFNNNLNLYLYSYQNKALYMYLEFSNDLILQYSSILNSYLYACFYIYILNTSNMLTLYLYIKHICMYIYTILSYIVYIFLKYNNYIFTIFILFTLTLLLDLIVSNCYTIVCSGILYYNYIILKSPIMGFLIRYLFYTLSICIFILIILLHPLVYKLIYTYFTNKSTTLLYKLDFMMYKLFITVLSAMGLSIYLFNTGVVIKFYTCNTVTGYIIVDHLLYFITQYCIHNTNLLLAIEFYFLWFIYNMATVLKYTLSKNYIFNILYILNIQLIRLYFTILNKITKISSIRLKLCTNEKLSHYIVFYILLLY